MAMRRQARTPEERDERMRDIRAAALDVFSAKGFSAARIDDIAAAAGVAKGTIYLYFNSKEDLLEAIVKSTIGVLLDTFEQAVAVSMSSSGATASHMLRLVGQALAHAIEDADRRRVL